MRRTAKRTTSTAKRSRKAKEDDLVFHWVGKGEKRDRSCFLWIFSIEVVYYNEVAHGQDHFCVGDTVELCASGRQPPLSGDYKVACIFEFLIWQKSWIAEIDSLWEDEEGTMWMENRWYYASQDIAASSRPPYRKR